MMKRDDGDDDFVTKTAKHRKKHGANGQQQQSTPSEHEHLAPSGSKADGKPPAPAASGGADGISLRPRTMFAMKGRGRTESEGSAYRPQWSKDGEGFVTAASSSSAATAAAPTNGGKDAGAAYHDPQGAADAARRKGKVLRYSKEELLALHFTTTSPPEFPPETMVASEFALPPVSTLPFDYEEIYEQWKLNRNRGGRGRGRGTNAGNNGQSDSGQQQSSSSDRSRSNGKWDDEKARRDADSQGDDNTWQRGIKPSAPPSRHRDDIWDNVGDGSSEGGEMDLSSMAMAAEKFRREMDALRSELNTSLAVDLKENDGNLDEFDKKLEVAAAAGQFEDSDEEDVQWDDPSDVGTLGGGSGSLGDRDHHHHSSLFFEQSSSAAGASSGASESRHFGLLDSKQFVVRDEWFYLDPQGIQQGPFKSVEMREWFEAGYFKPHLPIRFGHDGQFTPLANQFLHGQVPFAAPLPSPKIAADLERQRLGGNGSDHSGVPPPTAAPESFHSAMQPQFQSDFRTQHQHHLGSHDPALRDALFLNESHHARQQNEFWSQSAAHAPVLSSTDALFGQHQQQHQQHQQQQEQVQQQQSTSPPPAKTDPHAADPWGKSLTETATTSNSSSGSAAFSLHQIQDEEKRKAAEEVRGALSNSSSSVSSDKAAAAAKSPARPAKQPAAAASKQSPAAASKTPQKTSTTPAKTETAAAKKPAAAAAAAPAAKPKTKSSDAVKGAWVDPSAAPAKSLHEIQQEEQRELRKKMEASASGANLEQMGAQLKMMLGVQPVASAAAPAPTQQAPPVPSSSSGASPWGVPAAAAQPTQTSKQSLRDILAEEERLAQERAKQNQSSSSASSHWVNVVAGTTATPAPKPARSLGPVPVSVLKSRQQIRSTTATNGADAKSAAPTPPKAESDASFWNFGAAQAAPKTAASSASGASSAPGELQVSNAFGSSAGVSSEFMTWAAKQFQQISGRNDLTLMEYCMSLEDPGEIREYLAAYLGSTPRVSAFATEFIQRKKKGPAPALKRSPSNGGKNDGDDGAGGKKASGKRRGGKGQKIDPSLLSFA